jgi:hypothetical protein
MVEEVVVVGVVSLYNFYNHYNFYNNSEHKKNKSTFVILRLFKNTAVVNQSDDRISLRQD